MTPDVEVEKKLGVRVAGLGIWWGMEEPTTRTYTQRGSLPPFGSSFFRTTLWILLLVRLGPVRQSASEGSGRRGWREKEGEEGGREGAGRGAGREGRGGGREGVPQKERP
jgi:hypothetical protein